MKNYFTKSTVKPSADDYVNCHQLMFHIDELAPSDANVNAMIDRHPDGTYHAFIAIQASCGKFFAEAKTTNLMTSLKQAQNKIMDSLANWKGTRFVS